MQDIKLTPHFRLKEFVRSATAAKHEIVNEPPPEAVENLRKLCVGTLEPLREILGRPIIITSGYRCKTLNELITHHSTRSQHMQGQAADLIVQGSKVKVQGGQSPSSRVKVQGASHCELLVEAFRTIITDPTVDYDQLIIYPSFIHVSYISRERNRHKLTKGFGNGKYCALSRAEALSLI